MRDMQEKSLYFLILTFMPSSDSWINWSQGVCWSAVQPGGRVYISSILATPSYLS